MEELGLQIVTSPGLDGEFGTDDDKEVFFIGNIAPDEGLSAGFNAWMTFFGQFFDHGLDLVNKGGNGIIYIPLSRTIRCTTRRSPQTNFMVLTRATNIAVHAGDDGNLGTADDVHFHNNQTTPFVDQNQTYTSHPSHQVFLREYVLVDRPDDDIAGQFRSTRASCSRVLPADLQPGPTSRRRHGRARHRLSTITTCSMFRCWRRISMATSFPGRTVSHNS